MNAQEKDLRQKLSRAKREIESPEMLIVLDQAGQQVDAMEACATLTKEGVSTRVVHLGPLADLDPPAGTDSVFDIDCDVLAIGVVFPYGPAISALIDAARSLGTPVFEMGSSNPVDRLEECGAAPVTGLLVKNTVPDRASARWSDLVTSSSPTWERDNQASFAKANVHSKLIAKQNWSRFRNIHEGERCVIIGNGPSLNKLDLSRLKNEVTFGVNSIYLASEQMGFATTYYMVEDTLVMAENEEAIVNYPSRQKFFPAHYQKHFKKDAEGVTYFEMNQDFYAGDSPAFSVPQFSTDFGRRGYCGQSVTILNLQLAYYMGFSEVYLIGMDFSYVIPDTTIRNGNHLLSTGDDPNHFHPDYFGAGKTWKDPQLQRVAASYQLAKRVYSQDGRKILNATAGGELDIFPRVDFEEVFGD